MQVFKIKYSTGSFENYFWEKRGFFSKIGSLWRKSPCSTFCYYSQVMLIFKLGHSYHYKKLWAGRIPWNPVSIAQVSHEPLMTASFPKCRKKTDQSRIVMRFSGAVYYKNNKHAHTHAHTHTCTHTHTHTHAHTHTCTHTHTHTHTQTNKKIQPSKNTIKEIFRGFI